MHNCAIFSTLLPFFVKLQAYPIFYNKHCLVSQFLKYLSTFLSQVWLRYQKLILTLSALIPDKEKINLIFILIQLSEMCGPERVKFSEQSRSCCSFLNQKELQVFFYLWSMCIYFYLDIGDMLAPLKPLQLIYILHFINI